MRALDQGDHEGAIEHINQALAPAEDPAEPAEDPAEPAEEGPAEETLAHAEEFEPDRGTEEGIGIGVGAVLIAVGLGLLAIRRRTTPA
jgi:hypothetical protein